MNAKILKALNAQIQREGFSSQLYLAMASWADVNGLEGTASFLYKQSDEERMHMLKLVHFINERDGKVVIPAIDKVDGDYKNILDLCEKLLKHERTLTEDIAQLVHLCLEEKDYTTHNFMQWYVNEQLEEEAQARTILDKVKLVGTDKGGLYLLDNDLGAGKISTRYSTDNSANA